MKLSCIKILTIISKNKIESKAIPCVKKIAENIKLFTKDKAIIKQFLTCFKNQQLSSDKMISLQNMSKDFRTDKFHDLYNRTNNDIER